MIDTLSPTQQQEILEGLADLQDGQRVIRGLFAVAAQDPIDAQAANKETS